MFSWFNNRRREKLTQAPFPPLWEDIIRRNVAIYSVMNDAERAHLQALIQVFIAEKHWEGASGLELTDEIRVTVSAQACLLLLGLPHNYYKNVDSIIIYPTTVVLPQRQSSFLGNTLVQDDVGQPILGQAVHHGPVILIWDAALHGGRYSKDGHNVIYHEFAHKLDMLDGMANGTPPLRDSAEYREWNLRCSREYLRIKQSTEKGKKKFLNSYAATNEAEFFAVATEQFFEQPRLMIKYAPDLYHVLQEYYCQDPAEHSFGLDE